MKPSIIKAGISTAVTAAVTVTLAGIAPLTASAEPVSPENAARLTGTTVFLDPGHQGPGHAENLGRQVSDGRGGTKDCQTTGMTSVHGVPEHTINWNVSQLVKTALEHLGARVVLSRADDTGWGGCIDERARAANESGAAVAVSIHADSAPPAERGFHLIVPALPIPDSQADAAQSGEGRALSESVRDAYLAAGFPAATYAGIQNGLQTRTDIAGPALTRVPLVFVEMGNGANADDATELGSPEGQLKHAVAITTGLVNHLLGGAPPADTPAAAPESPTAAPTSAPAPADPQPEAAPTSEPQTPAAQAPGSPQVPAALAPPSRPAPGAEPSAPLRPKTPTLPGSSPDESSSLVGTVMKLLMPLAGALGMDDTRITAELINLAYTLASALLSPTD
ncbi:N-acetylmuramoyl-L-alanine amidase [Nocardia puris]|uniref:N-acetylmuramoyl-L-alanine amidase n=1 Tax=Nocardia puris TaxID=208602 RepID=A0A366E3R0_9NOCA|nr:N-acetylmuramoyl-L-alanine amidase [Nocardia puris]MBF6214676.1 N-acetylmuramoyl-L-alanine amidase [Nocardia puris]MBF6368850.1 N-acetylmuramoyl-L-alanine amidase [Nocardia puris]MBF6462430.1 N-acetylmuramoyl-L-alanine amidase [Nocardia puris]RBO97010.1 N-acetylmuramoyl-L-alanine amidase [Nocardia puris]